MPPSGSPDPLPGAGGGGDEHGESEQCVQRGVRRVGRHEVPQNRGAVELAVPDEREHRDAADCQIAATGAVRSGTHRGSYGKQEVYDVVQHRNVEEAEQQSVRAQHAEIEVADLPEQREESEA